MKIKLLTLLLIILLSLWTVQFSYANKSLQSRMEKEYLQFQAKTLLKQQVKSSDKGSDLHMSSLAIARKKALVSVHQSIEKIIADFRFVTPSCALSYDDASVLLVQNKQFKRFLDRMKDIDSTFTYSLDASSFTNACIKYINCTKPGSKERNTLSTDDYVSCTQDIANKFTQYLGLNAANNELSNYSYGDEIFDNGTLEDSSFDIAYDIEQIHKILFANPKRVRSFYLRWPPSYLSKHDNNNQNSSAYTSIQNYNYRLLSPSKLYAGNRVQATNIEEAIQDIKNAQEEEWSSITSNLQCFNPSPILQSDKAKEFKQEIKKLNKDTLTLQEEELIDNVIGTISQPYTEEIPPTPKISELPPEILNPLIENSTPDEIGGEGWILDTNGDNWWIIWDRWGSGGILNPNGSGWKNSSWNTNTKTNPTNSCPFNETNINEQFDLSDGKKLNIVSCLKKCSTCDEWFFKKTCYASCLCSKHVNNVTDSSMFGLTIGTKLCLVASTTPDMITPGTQIVSIQEIINQLGATIGKLKESGQYIPSSKPSEFFSPTLKIGKLSNLLNFNLSIRSAKKYNKPNAENKKTNVTEYYTTQIPNEAQLQINTIISQQDSYSTLITTHIEFRDKMNNILWWFQSAMKSFAAIQNGASK